MKEQDRKVVEAAKEGDPYAAQVLWDTLKLKVWTFKEIKGLNYLLQNERRIRRPRMGEYFRPTDRYIKLQLGINRTERNAKVNWIQDIGDDYFLFGVTIEQLYSGDPYGGAGAVWMCEFNGERFIPLFDVSQWTTDDLKLRAQTRKERKDEKETNKVNQQTINGEESTVQGDLVQE